MKIRVFLFPEIEKSGKMSGNSCFIPVPAYYPRRACVFFLSLGHRRFTKPKSMKMKKTLLIALLGLLSLKVTAQDIVSHDLGDFNQIVLSGKMNVTLVEGDRNSFEVKFHNTTGDRFTWNVTDGKLNLRLRINTQREGSADVRITYKKLDGLDVSQASVRAEEAVESDIFTLKAANGANIVLESQSKDLTVNADGNSAVTLSGETLYLTINANSKAKIDARALQARSAIVATQFNAEVFVWGTEKLDAKAGSNSVIFYKGTPEIFKTSTSMAGSVEQFSY